MMQYKLDCKKCCCSSAPIKLIPGQVIRTSASTNVSANTDTIILFDTIIGTDTIPINYSSGTFTIPSNGVYSICAMFTYDGNNTGTRRYIKINVNNITYMQLALPVIDGNLMDISTNLTNYFIAGDTFDITAYHDANAPINVLNSRVGVTQITRF